MDDRSHYTYSEILPDEIKETATAFIRRAVEHFAAIGGAAARVLTDNGSCYRPRDFATPLDEYGIAHKCTRPYRPHTNGKVEVQPHPAGRMGLRQPLHQQAVTHRGVPGLPPRLQSPPRHTALKGASPAGRVPNLASHYT
jgi:hypothetical protein